MSGRGGAERGPRGYEPDRDAIQANSRPEIPMYDPEIKERGFSVFGFVRLADAFLILTFDQDNFLHVYQADSAAFYVEKAQLNRDENIEISMPQVEIKDFKIVQIGGLEAPETKKAARISQGGEAHYLFYAKDGVTQEEREEVIPADTVHDLFFDRSLDGLPDEAGFFEFMPGAEDSVIAATFANHIEKDSATVLIIQPEIERSAAGTVQYNSQTGFTVFLNNILRTIQANASEDQAKVNFAITQALEGGKVNFETDQNRFNNILTLIWQIKALIETRELGDRGHSYLDDESIRKAVPWIIWGRLNSFEKWLYVQPSVTLKAESWQELLIDYRDFATLNYDLDDVANHEDIDDQRLLILHLENLMEQIMKNATGAQQTANRAMNRAISSGKVMFKDDDNLQKTQDRNNILTLVWRIDVLRKVYEAEKGKKLRLDKDLGKMVPWVKWDKWSQSTVGRMAQWLYMDPTITLSQEEWQKQIDEYISEFGIGGRKADWRSERKRNRNKIERDRY